MPIMDGYEATARIRQLGYLGPVIAATANNMDAERKARLSELGFNRLAPKPFLKQDAIRLLMDFGLLEADSV